MQFRAALLALLTSCVAGCLQPNITWLANSKEFVFIKKQPKPELVIYNVETGKQRAIPTPPEHHTVWPAVSPSGQEFAIAAGPESPDGEQRLLIYDQSGKVKKSKSLGANAKLAESSDNPVVLFWSADGAKILVAFSSASVIYDVERDDVIMVPDSRAMPIASTPITPDGKHFLAFVPSEHSGATQEDKVRPALVDWSGTISPISAESDEFLTEDAKMMLVVSSYFPSRWEGDSAVIESPEHSIHIQWRDLVATIEATPPDQLARPKILFQHTFPRTGLRLRLSAAPDKSKNHDLDCVIEKSLPGTNEFQPIAATTKYAGFSISPDKNYIVVQSSSSNKRRELVVINDKGEASGPFDAGEQ